MNYSLDQFNAIVAEIEGQGGAILPESCEGDALIYKIPGSDNTVKARTCGCTGNTLMVAPYEPSTNPKESKKLLGKGAGFIRACIVCDGVGLWPRFVKATEGIE